MYETAQIQTISVTADRKFCQIVLLYANKRIILSMGGFFLNPSRGSTLIFNTTRRSINVLVRPPVAGDEN